MTLKERLKGCLMGGAIGDALGGRYEGRPGRDFISTDFVWKISDDTQLTLATCEAIHQTKAPDPEKVASRFLYWFNQGRLSGLGASTLKALRELQVGGHWALVGRSGEYAAGNGAAMRIAPFAFKKEVSLILLRDICNITHKNDEAYTGALAIYYAIRKAVEGHWQGDADLIAQVIPQLPDTRVRDRLQGLNALSEKSMRRSRSNFLPPGTW